MISAALYASDSKDGSHVCNSRLTSALAAECELTSSSNFPSTRSSHEAMLPSESSASGLAGLKVLEM